VEDTFELLEITRSGRARILINQADSSGGFGESIANFAFAIAMDNGPPLYAKHEGQRFIRLALQKERHPPRSVRG